MTDTSQNKVHKPLQVTVGGKVLEPELQTKVNEALKASLASELHKHGLKGVGRAGDVSGHGRW